MIRFAGPADLPQIRALWELCFPDDTGFNDYYFAHTFALDTTLLYELEGQLAAMVQMLPYTVRIGTEHISATYIYGACTHPDFRRRHLMSALLEWSFAYDKAHGTEASMLIPQEAWLFDFYRPFGYEPHFALTTYTDTAFVCPARERDKQPALRRMTPADLPQCAALYLTKTADQSLAVVRTPEQWQAQLALFGSLGAGAFVWETQGSLTGYAFVWNEENGIWAQEFVCMDDGDAAVFRAALAAETGAAAVRVSVPDADGTFLGCIKCYGERSVAQNGYMNLMYN